MGLFLRSSFVTSASSVARPYNRHFFRRRPQHRPSDVSPDGQTLLFTERTVHGGENIFTLRLGGPATPSAMFGSNFHERDPRFSPDGRAIAFVSDESGRFEVYVAPFPSAGGKTLVSAGTAIGGDLPGNARWSHDGRELYYVSADRRLMAVPVRTTPKLEVMGRPAPLFTLQGRTWSDFTVSPDGKRFLGRGAAGLGPDVDKVMPVSEPSGRGVLAGAITVSNEQRCSVDPGKLAGLLYVSRPGRSEQTHMDFS
jgi:Tol biopolymer transport system component